ncbi:hypothetical protein, partial [Ruminococcus sp.]|uniref:hypothetical protein n=1 Tax=Ruminococcus sp. TaxID=41978 RepID=UPI00386A2526
SVLSISKIANFATGVLCKYLFYNFLILYGVTVTTFLKLLALCGRSPQYFSLRKILIAKQFAVWRLEQIGESLCESNKGNTLHLS